MPLISIIIPTLNEAENITKTIKIAQKSSQVEIIVVDGGSKDQTLQLAKSCGVETMTSSAGRSRQMNAGAAKAKGDILLFLHADTLLPQEYDTHIRCTIQDSNIAVGAFTLVIQGHSYGLRIVEFMTMVRSRWLKMPYGDQGIFLKSECFWAAGGFPDIPIMEDFVFVRALRQRGRIVTLPAQVITSNRRWRSLGIFRTTIMNQAIILGYLAGVNPSYLAKLYKPFYLNDR